MHHANIVFHILSRTREHTHTHARLSCASSLSLSLMSPRVIVCRQGRMAPRRDAGVELAGLDGVPVGERQSLSLLSRANGRLMLLALVVFAAQLVDHVAVA